MAGQPPQAWQLFSSDQLYHWPIGYHLHLILGQIVSGSVAGGRAITLFMAVGATVVLYLLVGELWPGASRLARVLAGLVAGAALPLVATYTRMGLSLMSDVPALFWGLLGIYCCLRAWPVRGSEYRVPSTEYQGDSKRNLLGTRYPLWALAGGDGAGCCCADALRLGLLPGAGGCVLSWRPALSTVVQSRARDGHLHYGWRLGLWWAFCRSLCILWHTRAQAQVTAIG